MNDDFLEHPAAELAAPLLAQSVTPLGASDLLRRLQAALADRYRLDSELAGAGMSRVYVGEELGLGRRVVVKVLPPEVAAGTSAERFRQEIHLAASLQHPHIVPLLSAGSADGLLYYTMPLVEGESLRRRLERLGPLSIDETIRVLREVAAALAYAHRRGIVHRDIKPGNILLTDDAALVLDFGVAKALSPPGGATAPVTVTGLALGTPAYMAPEQAAGDEQVDHRADLYALGCVGYEMVSGRPPFKGPTLQAMFVAHATEAPAPISSLRPDLPPALADLIMTLLEKTPAGRPESAAAVLHALEGKTVGVRQSGTPPTRTTPARARRWVAAGAAAALAAALLVPVLGRQRHRSRLDAHLVAIAPFLVSSSDSSLAYLREGMVDLLATKLNGTAGLRAADPRTLLGAPAGRTGASTPGAGEVTAQAAHAGAGRLIRGEVVGTGASLTISASVIDVEGGQVRTQATVEGSSDSVTRLVDGLAARLLAADAGESPERLVSLTSTSLPALRAYLDGQSLLRHGLFEPAKDRFDLALRLDSTFALAGLGRDRAVEWIESDDKRGSLLAWRHRERLSPRDRAQLAVILGPRFPAPSQEADYFDAVDRFVQAAPDSPEAWYELGDALFHSGHLIGMADALPRARAAFDRSLALDPTFAPALEHGPLLAFELGGAAELRSAAARFLAVDSTSARAAEVRWYLAVALGDSAGAESALRDDRILARSYTLSAMAVSQGIGIRQVGHMLERARRKAVTDQERTQADENLYDHLMQVGRPSQAQPLLASTRALWQHVLPATIGLFGDGDSAAMVEGITALARELGSPLDAANGGAVYGRYLVGQYALARGRESEVRRAMADLVAARASPDSEWAAHSTQVFAQILEAQLAAWKGAPNAARLLDALDSMLLTGPRDAWLPGNLVSARLHEQRGELSAALAAVRRRYFATYDFPELVTYLREEGRLAALTGDRAGAIKAYRLYLAVRSDPEPALRPQVAQIRADLAALERGTEPDTGRSGP